MAQEPREFTASIYVVHDKAVLLVFHKRFNQWVPIGGRRDGNELPQETASREMLEETGLTGTFSGHFLPTKGSPTGLMSYDEHDAGPRGWHMNFAFRVLAPSRDVTPCDEFTEHGWFRVDQLDGIDAPDDVRTLAKLALSTPLEPVVKNTCPKGGEHSWDGPWKELDADCNCGKNPDCRKCGGAGFYANGGTCTCSKCGIDAHSFFQPV